MRVKSLGDPRETRDAKSLKALNPKANADPRSNAWEKR
jgi:hypothetical protein